MSQHVPVHRPAPRPEPDFSQYRLPEPVYVTSPSLPSLERYTELLAEIWASKRLANSGNFHNRLERKLEEHLGVDHVCLFCNGTVALLVALQALGIDGGEVITTPFTFPATTHALNWNNVTPVFCDIDPVTFNIDPNRIEELITPQTRAILPVHVFGVPCDVDAIGTIAAKHGLRVIYDAAHAFGVEINGESVLEYGDLSMLSFHATKHFNTGEGGALVARTPEQRKRLEFLKNFGIANEETVIGPGINGKMSELQAAYGLLNLETVELERARRGKISSLYRELLAGIPGLRFSTDVPGITHNYTYFPILIDENRYGARRDELRNALKSVNVFARKYFYPLCSDYDCYGHLPSAMPENLPVARQVADQVLCLPIFADLPHDTVRIIARVIREFSI